MATHKENIIRVFNKYQRPMQLKEVTSALRMYMAEKPDPLVIAVVLTRCIKEGMLARAKYKRIATFYCKPEWVKDGKVKEELNFDPYWNKQITDEHKN